MCIQVMGQCTDSRFATLEAIHQSDIVVTLEAHQSYNRGSR